MKTFILRDNQVRERAISYIKSLPLDPLLEVEIGLHEELRTLRQNKRYWAAVIQPLSELTGKPGEAWHRFFKKRFIGFDEVEICGEIQQVEHSTTKLKKKEFNEFVTRVEVYVASELGIDIYGFKAAS